MRILGISAFYHDSAASLLVDGHIVAAAQEERFTRKKQDARFPVRAIAYCLEEGGTTLADVDYVVFYEKPFLKFERLLETYVAFAPRGYKSFAMAIPIWIREKLFQKDIIRRALETLAPGFDWQNRLLFTEHHLSHAASAFYASPFQNAAVLTMDGVGEWCTASAAVGRGNTLELQKELNFPHSLGLLYSAFTYYTGFKVNSGEYKLMGLAPYGEPKYVDRILDHLIDLKDDGSFRLDLDYFDYCTGLTMTNQKFADLFGAPVRDWKKELLTPFHMDIAASIQKVTEEVMLRLARALSARTRPRQSLPGRRRRAQLRRQRQDFARRRLQEHLGAARSGRRRRGGRRRARGVASVPRQRPQRRRRARPDEGRIPWAGLRTVRHRTPSRRRGREIHRAPRRGYDRDDGGCSGRRRGGRLDAGAHGVRPPRARGALRSRRPALAVDAEDAQSAGEVPRELPAVRARRDCASTSPNGSSSMPILLTCCWSPT